MSFHAAPEQTAPEHRCGAVCSGALYCRAVARGKSHFRLTVI